MIAELPSPDGFALPDHPAGQAAQPGFIDPQKFPHAVAAAAAATAAGVDPKVGLRAQELTARRRRYGTNTLQSVRQRSAWNILAAQFFNIIIALLAIAAVVALATGDLLQALSIIVVMVLNVEVANSAAQPKKATRPSSSSITLSSGASGKTPSCIEIRPPLFCRAK